MRLALILLLIFATPAFSVDVASYDERVALKEYINRIFAEKDRYNDIKYDALKELFLSVQTSTKEALSLSRVELDRRFVRIDEYSPERNRFNIELQSIDKRLAVVETEGRWQSTMWALGVSVFFSVIIVVMKMWDRKKSNG